MRELRNEMAEKMAAHLMEIPLTIEATKNARAEQKPAGSGPLSRMS
jgi:hypothetical protein